MRAASWAPVSNGWGRPARLLLLSAVGSAAPGTKTPPNVRLTDPGSKAEELVSLSEEVAGLRLLDALRDARATFEWEEVLRLRGHMRTLSPPCAPS